eukprot:scaffold25986_cov53-Prasinocladus_malaysianus.AAC.1
MRFPHRACSHYPWSTVFNAQSDCALSACPPGCAGGGADNLICQVLLTLKKVSSESALLTYLESLRHLKVDCLCEPSRAHLHVLSGKHAFNNLEDVTRIKLQGELYMLTNPGGPRYPPAPVRKAAADTLDILFPHGALMRRTVNAVFRALHPEDWPYSRQVFAAASGIASVALRTQWSFIRLWASFCAAVMSIWLLLAGGILARWSRRF